MIVKGTLQLTNVSTREFAKLIASLREVSHYFTIEYKGIGATRSGDVCFLNKDWHMMPQMSKTPTERREFFSVCVDREIIAVKPENGSFEGLRVNFVEV